MFIALSCTPVPPERCSTVASPKVSAVTARPSGCSAAAAKRTALARWSRVYSATRTWVLISRPAPKRWMWLACTCVVPLRATSLAMP